MEEEISFTNDQWDDQAKRRLHREGLTVVETREENGRTFVTVERRLEVRVERPDGSGDASTEVGII